MWVKQINNIDYKEKEKMKKLIDLFNKMMNCDEEEEIKEIRAAETIMIVQNMFAI